MALLHYFKLEFFLQMPFTFSHFHKYFFTCPPQGQFALYCTPILKFTNFVIAVRDVRDLNQGSPAVWDGVIVHKNFRETVNVDEV